MNLEQAVAMTNLKKRSNDFAITGEKKTAKEIAELVFDLSAAAGEPYKNATSTQWAKRWLGSKKFLLLDIDPRQVAVPFVNRISRAKVLAAMQASAAAISPMIVDVNLQQVGKTETGYIPSVIVVDGKHRHRAQILCGRERVQAWVGEDALVILQARAATRKKFVVEKPKGENARQKSQVEIHAMLTGQNPAQSRMDTGEGGTRPIGPPHESVRSFKATGSAGGNAGPGGGVSGNNPLRQGFDAADDPSDKGQSLDPSDKAQFNNEPDNGNPAKQAPGAGVGQRIKAGPVQVKKIVTDKK